MHKPRNAWSFQKQEEARKDPGQEDPLEEEMAIRYSVLAWEIPWTEEPSGMIRWLTDSDKEPDRLGSRGCVGADSRLSCRSSVNLLSKLHRTLDSL